MAAFQRTLRAAGAADVLAKSDPAMTTEQYLRHQTGRFNDELYESV